MSSGSSKPPKAPDPQVVIDAQTRANRVNQVGPYGTSRYSTDENGNATQTSELSPELQAIYARVLGMAGDKPEQATVAAPLDEGALRTGFERRQADAAAHAETHADGRAAEPIQPVREHQRDGIHVQPAARRLNAPPDFTTGRRRPAAAAQAVCRTNADDAAAARIQHGGRRRQISARNHGQTSVRRNRHAACAHARHGWPEHADAGTGYTGFQRKRERAYADDAAGDEQHGDRYADGCADGR